MSLKKVPTILAALFYAIFFVFILGIPFADWDKTIVGSGPDPYQYIWNADVFATQIKNGQNPFFTQKFFYPEGASLLMHTYTPIIGILNLVLKNPYLSCNIALLLSFVLSGLGAFLLASLWIRNNWWAFLAGFIFAFSPFKTAHLMEHYHLLLTAQVPFYVYFVFKFFPEGIINFNLDLVKKITVLFGLGVISLLSDYYTTYYLIAFTIIYFAYAPLKEFWKKTYFKYRWVIVIFLISGFHFLMEAFYHHPKTDDKGAIYNTSDIAALFTPSENNRCWNIGPIFEQMRQKMHFKGPNEQVVFLGFSFIFLFLLLVITSKNSIHPSAQIWFYLGVFFLFLCFPKIKFLGQTIMYTPLSWLHLVPFFNHIRNPSRAIMMVYLFLPIAVFIWFQSIEWKNKFLSNYTPILLTIFVIIEFSPLNYAQISQNSVAPIYSQLAKNEEINTIWHIPTGVIDGFRQEGDFDIQNLQQQMVHRKNLIGGYISRVDSATFEYFKTNPILQFANNKESNDVKFDENMLQNFLAYHQIEVVIFDTSNIQGKILMNGPLAKHIKNKIINHDKYTLFLR